MFSLFPGVDRPPLLQLDILDHLCASDEHRSRAAIGRSGGLGEKYYSTHLSLSFPSRVLLLSLLLVSYDMRILKYYCLKYMHTNFITFCALEKVIMPRDSSAGFIVTAHC
jgi:hypothetical protein